MKVLKPIVYFAALTVLGICVYSFLLGSGILVGSGQTPGFHSDPFAWYFLAKGLFCSLSLYIAVNALDTMHSLKTALLNNVAKTGVNTQQPQETTQQPYHTVTTTPTEKSWYQARQGVGH